jgi:hypothetical protein
MLIKIKNQTYLIREACIMYLPISKFVLVNWLLNSFDFFKNDIKSLVSEIFCRISFDNLIIFSKIFFIPNQNFQPHIP